MCASHFWQLPAANGIGNWSILEGSIDAVRIASIIVSFFSSTNCISICLDWARRRLMQFKFTNSFLFLRRRNEIEIESAMISASRSVENIIKSKKSRKRRSLGSRNINQNTMKNLFSWKTKHYRMCVWRMCVFSARSNRSRCVACLLHRNMRTRNRRKSG